MKPRKFSQRSNFQGPENPGFSRKEDRKTYFIFIRYLIILAAGLFAFSSLYAIFTPLTIQPSNLLLSFFYNTSINGNQIIIGGFLIELVEACIAGSAYYLLFLLNLSLPMKLKTRILSITFSFMIFLVINVLRIFIFSLLYINNFRYFDVTHMLFWYVISGVIVFLVWLATIKTFKLTSIPFYTDLNLIYSQIKQKSKK